MEREFAPVVPADDGYYYLASPYTHFPGGKERAARMAAAVAASLIELGYVIYCPIAHCYAVSKFMHPDKDNGDTWLPQDFVLLGKAKGVFVIRYPCKSEGVDAELEEAERLGLPIYDLYPDEQILEAIDGS
jgi:hypothetical protein